MLRIHHFMKHVCLHYPRAMWTDIDMDINGPPGRVSTNASEHAMLHNMFLPRHPETRNEYGAC